MSTTHAPLHTPSALCTGCGGPLAGPADTMLTVEHLQQRYGSGRDKTYELIGSAGFVRSILPGTGWVASLEALQTWELSHQLAGTVAALPQMLPAPPAAGRPGRKAGSR